MMIKHILFTAALVIATAMAGEAIAACNTGTRVQNLAGTGGKLIGNTVCDGTTGAWKAQEFHSGSPGNLQNLIDWKQGLADYQRPSGDSPPAPVGTWNVANDGSSTATVTYGYYIDTNNPHTGGTTNYTYSVWDTGAGTYDFCSNDTALVTTVTIKTGQGACP